MAGVPPALAKKAVACPICGQLFFPASLKFHVKACAAKHEAMEVPCQFCDAPFRRSEMPAHLKRCAKARAARRQRKRDILQQPAPSTAKDAPPVPPGAPVGGGFGGSVRCAICQRSFAADRIATHQRICRKATRKGKTARGGRGVFDARAQRCGGLDDGGRGGGFGMPPPLRGGGTRRAGPRARGGRSASGGTGRGGAAVPKTQGKWRQQRAAFQAAMRAARGAVPGGAGAGAFSPLSGGGLGAGADESAGMTMVPCPHCTRTFSEAAAERHVPRCAGMRARPAPPRRELHIQLQQQRLREAQVQQMRQGAAAAQAGGGRARARALACARAGAQARPRAVVARPPFSIGSGPGDTTARFGRDTRTRSSVAGAGAGGGIASSNDTSSDNPMVSWKRGEA
eukprot:g2286.t1